MFTSKLLLSAHLLYYPIHPSLHPSILSSIIFHHLSFAESGGLEPIQDDIGQKPRYTLDSPQLHHRADTETNNHLPSPQKKVSFFCLLKGLFAKFLLHIWSQFDWMAIFILNTYSKIAIHHFGTGEFPLGGCQQFLYAGNTFHLVMAMVKVCYISDLGWPWLITF